MPQAAPTRRRWFQFRLSFLFCVVGLAAVALTGAQFSLEDLIPSFLRSVEAPLAVGLAVYPAIAVAAVLLLGRSSAVVPVASGFLVSAALDCCLEIFVGFISTPFFNLSLQFVRCLDC